MKISGVMPLRNAVKLGYPFVLAIRSLRRLCDEVVVLVDPTSEDDTVARVRALGPDRLVESVWNMDNHTGHVHGEIAVQTSVACAAATGDWVFSLQADEVIHERDVAAIRERVLRADGEGVTGLEMRRVYFFGGLETYREDWTVPLLRLYRNGCWVPDPKSGAMQFIPVAPTPKAAMEAMIYHYSRVGDPLIIARRVRNLDLFYHSPEGVAAEDAVAPYDFRLRKLDSYAAVNVAEDDPHARLIHFPLEGHPEGVREYFHA